MNSTSANYKAITKTQEQYKKSINTKKQNAKWTKREQYGRTKQYKGRAGTKTPQNTDKLILKMPKIGAEYVSTK